VLFTQVVRTGGSSLRYGTIDLNFTLTIGAESVSQTATYEWETFNNVFFSGLTGADARRDQIGPLIFEFSIGTLYLTDSSTSTNLLGEPVGATEYGRLNVLSGYFTPIPEPSTVVLISVCIIHGVVRRTRRGKR
jgi:hypothetical protein